MMTGWFLCFSFFHCLTKEVSGALRHQGGTNRSVMGKLNRGIPLGVQQPGRSHSWAKLFQMVSLLVKLFLLEQRWWTDCLCCVWIWFFWWKIVEFFWKQHGMAGICFLGGWTAVEWKGLPFKGLQELSRPNLSETASSSFALGEVDRWTNLQIGTRKKWLFCIWGHPPLPLEAVFHPYQVLLKDIDTQNGLEE